MLTNITIEATQRTNRFSQSSPYGPCSPTDVATSGSRGQSPLSTTMYPELSIPTAFTPYTPAASIPRYHHQQQQQQPASGQTAQRTSQHHSEPAYQPQQQPQHEAYQAPSATVYHARHHTPSPTNASLMPHMASMATAAPVYGPSSVSPYQLFVDVVSGATLSIDDDEAMMHCSGYVSPTMPDVTVGAATPYHSVPQPSANTYHEVSERVGPSSVDPATERCPCVYCVPSQHEEVAMRPAALPTKAQEQAPKQPSTHHTPSTVSVGAQPTTTTAKVVATTPKSASTPKVAAASAVAPSSNKAPSAAPTVYTVEVIGHHRRPQTVVSHIPLEEGAHVVFEGDRGIDMAVVATVQPCTTKGSLPSGTSMVVRSATKEEIELWTTELPQLAADAATECSALVQSMRLKMAVRGASYQLDKQKLTFFYETSEHRVDFRKLLIELFNRYRCRIWMEKAIPEGK